MIIRLVNLSHKKEEAGCNEETWGLDEAVRRAGSYEAGRMAWKKRSSQADEPAPYTKEEENKDEKDRKGNRCSSYGSSNDSSGFCGWSNSSAGKRDRAEIGQGAAR